MGFAVGLVAGTGGVTATGAFGGQGFGLAFGVNGRGAIGAVTARCGACAIGFAGATDAMGAAGTDRVGWAAGDCAAGGVDAAGAGGRTLWLGSGSRTATFTVVFESDDDFAMKGFGGSGRHEGIGAGARGIALMAPIAGGGRLSGGGMEIGPSSRSASAAALFPLAPSVFQ